MDDNNKHRAILQIVPKLLKDCNLSFASIVEFGKPDSYLNNYIK